MKNVEKLKHDLKIEYEEDKNQAEDFFKNHSDQEAMQLIEEQITTVDPSINYTLDGYNAIYSFIADKPHEYQAVLSLYKTDEDGDVIDDSTPDYTIICEDDGIKLLDSLDNPTKYIK
ncbi:hypothetical protein M3M44_08510 [Lactobacillus johnsonii]|uniref:hypothetical protein n=1 Tax=Lactobacillus johnsonii TaxID=33959 RepID=UPI00201AD12E|nr:hypothetical protein [Lactobacillus johnsonii]MCL5444315.1 hypothetical protein [Lactobacillus johnsonii]